ncbi:alpha/beta fold hydrolase [Aestuariibacter sp. A3R04]|uniref:alpha/beta fold hydrolase n=1 Tax=Aestuariibacter sp. A3R04 TaxID=2841571 RepID=UPI001C08D01A|nr:alpha/beta fold hydrolase [Aestuariibacter sp. A3R04]MBU3021685.1 alpha/beta hydrolase [Aestuariibacter sp. A3R04]
MYGNTLRQDSIFIDDGHHQLHLRHIRINENGPPVLMLHGVIENGRIFYTESGKGLACFLAAQGYNVYVADMRGRGKSVPPISEDHNHDQYDQITRDIPLFLNYVFEHTRQPVHAIAHSWGGVLLASALVRFPELSKNIRSKICFGTKRSVRVQNPEKWFKVDFVWKWLCPKVARRKGFLPGAKMKIGADDETYGSLCQGMKWVELNPWVDPKDQFNYAQAAKETNWPVTWHIAAANDYALGHPRDVRDFIAESVGSSARFTVLSRKNGNLFDYDHINMLTHPRAVEDHFPSIAQWLNEQCDD